MLTVYDIRENTNLTEVAKLDALNKALEKLNEQELETSGSKTNSKS
jgi:hypothetical protein